MDYFFIYYMNLMFSALSEDDQRMVIDQCLDPLLELADDGLRFGLQVSGVSLEIINNHRPDLIDKISNLIKDKKIDFIGNGYAQIIQPLFPHDLNTKNQILGQKAYEDILGYRPDICTINEMAYSSGSCESIINAGYKTILMEWNNANSITNSKDIDQYSKAKTLIGNNEVDILWCDTIAFQKFQKYAHGEINLETYCSWLSNYTFGHEGSLCLYCSDAEIFGFRPKRYGTEISPKLDEWKRIKLLMEKLIDDTILPSKISKTQESLIKLTNSENPIIVKKQQKYNINRWGVTGRNDHNLNTFCYSLLNHAKGIGDSFSGDDWKNLLKLSSSDLRTHIEDQRWEKAKKIKEDFTNRFADIVSYSEEVCLSQHDNELAANVDRKRGNNIISWPDNNPSFGRVELGTFSKTSLMADFYSGFAVIEKLGHRKISDLDYEASVTNNETYNEFQNSQGYKIKKTILSNAHDTLDITVSILVPERTREQIKPCNFSLTSENWDIDTLYYSAKLGGSSTETFKFGKNSFDQDSILNLNVIGTNGFCPTDGVLIIGDKNKKISFISDPSNCFNLVRLTYDVDEGKNFLLRICFIVQDIDETFREDSHEQSFEFKCAVRHEEQ